MVDKILIGLLAALAGSLGGAVVAITLDADRAELVDRMRSDCDAEIRLVEAEVGRCEERAALRQRSLERCLAEGERP